MISRRSIVVEENQTTHIVVSLSMDGQQFDLQVPKLTIILMMRCPINAFSICCFSQVIHQYDMEDLS